MRRLWVSVSGGRTSAYMAIRLQTEFADRFDMKFVYANTGLEHEETLLFLDRIDRRFQLGIVWLEAVINAENGVGTTHKVVDFDSACRDGQIFEDMIDVYGIPNTAYPHCTRELKIAPMESYMKSIGWGHEYRAIGIRIDEQRRASKNAVDRKLYPLIDFFPTDKQDVLDWFDGKDYDLKLVEHLGNCVTCWKKSDPKLIRIMRDDPSRFDFFSRMEDEKGLCGHNEDGTPRTFFRNNRRVSDLIAMESIIPELDFGNLSRCATEECGME